MDKEEFSHVVGLLMLLPVFGAMSALAERLKAEKPTPVTGLLLLATIMALASAILLTACATVSPQTSPIPPAPAFALNAVHDPQEVCLTLLALACMKSEECKTAQSASDCFAASSAGCNDVVAMSTTGANACADALLRDCKEELPSECRGIGTVADRPLDQGRQL